ncbi:MAG: hypothetical protein K0B15_02520 [Lentimicrobium sp.]|nr:hypothetical protein [Lentimicrobium sp.]
MNGDKLISSGVFSSAWQSPSNIALIKYWGKYSNQLPRNASLSITLKNAVTRTSVKVFALHESESGLKLEFSFGGESKSAFSKKIESFLNSVSDEFTFLKNCRIEIISENSFPHSAGIASSASSMSALALCLCDIRNQISGVEESEDTFFRNASNLARLGSGSASRSVFGGFSIWGKHENIIGSSDQFAIPLPVEIHDIYKGLRNTILIVDSSEKKVSSSIGHNLLNGHPFAEARFQQANKNLSKLLTVLGNGNWDEFMKITENEALSLHAMMMSSDPGYMLIHPNTLIIINKIKEYREKKNTKVCFTLDAGPNIHMLYPESEINGIAPLLKEVQGLCVNRLMMEDCIGNGPEKLTNY